MEKITITRDDLLVHIPSGDYPVTLHDMPTRHRNVSMGPKVPLDYLESKGYRWVKRSPKPVANVVKEIDFKEIDGILVQQWEGRPYTQEELDQILERKKADAVQDLRSMKYTVIEEGFTVNNDGSYHNVSLSLRVFNYIALAAQAANFGADYSHDIICKDGGVMKLTSKQVIELFKRVSRGLNELRQQMRELEEEIASSAHEGDLPGIVNRLALHADYKVIYL